MALWRCRGCGTRFAVGLSYCPQCTSTDHEEDGEDMAKITKHGGATNAAADAEAAAAEFQLDTAADLAAEGGEQPSPGNSSSTSDGKPPSPPEQSAPARRRSARTTGSPSSGARKGSSSARGETTNTPETGDADTDGRP